jgi:DNA-binding HxlR family transcriptional regulator
MGNPVARAYGLTGDAWTQLILREAFYGVRRFSGWRERLGTPRSVLTDRLNKLVTGGLLERRGTGEGVRTEYRLTEMGIDMFGVAVMQGQWERNWAHSPLQERYAIAFLDRETGRRLRPAVLCRPGGREIDPDDVDWRPGPGLTRIAGPTSRRRRSEPKETDRPIIDRSTEIMGDYWSWSVLSAAYFRLRRFDEIHAALGVATNILADRLTRLVHYGVLKKIVYQTAPVRHEYRLTQAGLGLYPVVLAMHGWAERWMLDEGEAPVTLIRRSTREEIHPVVCDLGTGEPLQARRLRWEVEAAPDRAAAGGRI